MWKMSEMCRIRVEAGAAVGEGETGISRDLIGGGGVVIDPGISPPATLPYSPIHCITDHIPLYCTGSTTQWRKVQSSRMLRLFAQAAAAVILSCVTDARSPLPRDVQATAAYSPLSEARSPRQMAARRPNDQRRMETSLSLSQLDIDRTEMRCMRAFSVNNQHRWRGMIEKSPSDLNVPCVQPLYIKCHSMSTHY